MTPIEKAEALAWRVVVAALIVAIAAMAAHLGAGASPALVDVAALSGMFGVVAAVVMLVLAYVRFVRRQ
jgi:uncharacterized membrane protein